MTTLPKFVWEILVPTEMERDGKLKPIKVRYHKKWDEKVKQIAGGLTILQPTKGYWVSVDGKEFFERMIPVRIVCTGEEIQTIADMTANYYNQLAVMFYKVSEVIHIKHYGAKKK